MPALGDLGVHSHGDWLRVCILQVADGNVGARRDRRVHAYELIFRSMLKTGYDPMPEILNLPMIRVAGRSGGDVDARVFACMYPCAEPRPCRGRTCF